MSTWVAACSRPASGPESNSTVTRNPFDSRNAVARSPVLRQQGVDEGSEGDGVDLAFVSLHRPDAGGELQLGLEDPHLPQKEPRGPVGGIPQDLVAQVERLTHRGVPSSTAERPMIGGMASAEHDHNGAGVSTS